MMAAVASATSGASETGLDFQLIETMLWTPAGGIARCDRHLARLTESADRLGFRCDRAAIEARLLGIAGAEQPLRLRVALRRDGEVALSCEPAPSQAVRRMWAVVRPMSLSPDDVRLRHKTSERDHYDLPRRMAAETVQADEVLFVDAAGFLTEGSFTSLFVRRGDVLLTPPLSRGLLPGVLRACLLDEKRAVEADLRFADLAEGLMLGNSLRGLMDAVLIAEP